jgi:RimJ/RimL family protein N-acetyltransferase
LDRLAGEYVLLEPVLVEDVTPRYVDWLNDPEVVKYSNQRFISHSTESCIAYINSFENTSNKLYKIVKKSDLLMIGTLTAYINPFHKTVDMGILLGDRNCWGKGFGGDAWVTLLNFLLAAIHVRKITAGTLRCNQAMINIMQRSGMQLEAVRVQQELIDGAPQDLVYFARFNEKSV